MVLSSSDLGSAATAGPAGFVATFLSASDPTAFHIGTARVNPSFTGQNLMDTSLGSADTLTISLNQPVTSVRLDFALFEPGWLSLQSPAGSAIASTALSQGGSLSFQSAVGFNSFSLAGYTSQGTPTLLGIDNLEMVVVPEPAIAPMIAAGLALWVWNRQRRAGR